MSGQWRLIAVDFYKLNPDGTTEPCTIEEWSQWMAGEGGDKHIAETFTHSCRVSTVFLGINHAFGRGAPVLFETMVFENQPRLRRSADGWEMGFSSLYGIRYRTVDEARAGHAKVVQLLESLTTVDAAVIRRELGKLDDEEQ